MKEIYVSQGGNQGRQATLTLKDPTEAVELSTTVNPGFDAAGTSTRSIKLPPPVSSPYRNRQRQSLQPRARLVTLGLLGFLAAVVVRLVALAADIAVLREGTVPDSAVGSIPLDTEATLALVARIGLALFGAIAAVSFVAWLQRARDNWATQGRPRFSAQWTVLMWLVPGVNLWRPAQFVADLFAERPGMRRLANSDAWLIAAWWIPGVIGLFGQVALRLWAAVTQADLASEIDATDQNDWHYLAFGAYTLMAISAISAFFIVRALTKRHDISNPG